MSIISVSEDQIDLTASIENLVLVAEPDCLGIPTYGFGRTWKDGIPVKLGMTCTKAEALLWLYQDLDHACVSVSTSVGYKLPQNQLDAVSDMVFNMGNKCPGLLSLLKAQRPNYSELASHEFLNGIYGKGKPFLGLLRRRITNYNTFMFGTYDKFSEGDKITSSLKSLLLQMNPNQDAQAMINKLQVHDA